jgi:3-methyladenine DNA glycosylase AlkD
MQAYMKSSMPYYGVSAQPLRALCRTVFPQYPLSSGAEWRQAVRFIWDGATHREERYAAIELLSARRYAPYHTPRVIPLYRHLIVTGAWWDTVDWVAHRVGDFLARDPAVMKPVLLAWARGENPWLRRVAIIGQISFRNHTDRELLWACIEPSLDERDFFLRKAIGWALREYAKADPDTVAQYLRTHEMRLSPLSCREARKGLAFVERHGRRIIKNGRGGRSS